MVNLFQQGYFKVHFPVFDKVTQELVTCLLFTGSAMAFGYLEAQREIVFTLKVVKTANKVGIFVQKVIPKCAHPSKK